MKKYFSTKPILVLLTLVFVSTVMPKAFAGVEGPTIVSPMNLKVDLPARLVPNKSFSVYAVAPNYKLSGNITEIEYVWKIDVCGTKQTVVKKVSNNPTAYRHTFSATFTQGCRMNIDVDVMSYAGSVLIDSTVPVEINTTLTSSKDIALTGPTTVKVGSIAAYDAKYQLSAGQIPVWARGVSCRITKLTVEPSNGVYLEGFTFHWEPKKAQSCKEEAYATYVTKTSTGAISNVELAYKNLSVTSVN